MINHPKLIMKNKKLEQIRLNRFIAMCGICSRRKADNLIQSGNILINNVKITSLGHVVQFPKDIVSLNGVRISPQKMQYILLNKPKGYITTTRDEMGRKTVMSLVEDACEERIVPVGRLDKNTTGLLLFTNDGKLAKKLTHPKHHTKKIYHVGLDRSLKKSDLIKIKKGILLQDGFIQVDYVSFVDESPRLIKLEIHVGKNRIVRRIFEFLNYEVKKLDRVGYSFLKKDSLRTGRWRTLTSKEIKLLKKDG